jgi:hypothetical protein
MAKEKVIVVSVGGLDAVPESILLELNDKFGAEGFVVVEPKDLPNHVKNLPEQNQSHDIIKSLLKTAEERFEQSKFLNEKSLSNPPKPIDAILKKRKFNR